MLAYTTPSASTDHMVGVRFVYTGTADITGVTAGAGLAGGGTAGNVTLAVGAESITGAMILNGSVSAADLAPGSVTLNHLTFDPATQLELDAHKTSADHDARYYTKTQADALFPPVRTRLPYSVAINTTTVTGSYVQILSVGTFTKQRSTSDVVLHWTGHASMTGSAPSFCDYQVRIDGADDGVGAGRAILTLTGTATSTANPFGVTTLFPSLAGGLHTVSIWLRGSASSCFLNPGVFAETLLVEESGS